MKNFKFLFLLLCIQSCIIGMEVERKSLVSFFNVDIPDTNEDISQIIAGYYTSDHQWWYLDKMLEHQGDVKSACFNKLGTEILTSVYEYKNYHFCIWDSSSGGQVVKEKTKFSIKTAMFGEVENKIILLEKKTLDNLLYFFERDKNIIKHDVKPQSLGGQFSCLNSTKTEVLERCNDGIGVICVRNIATGKLVLDIHHNMPFFSAKFNTSGDEIIATDTDGMLLIFNKKGKELLRCKHDYALEGASFNQEANELLVYGDCSIVYVRDRKSGEILLELKHPKNVDNVYFAYFNNKGNQICTVADDQMVRIWDRDTGKIVAQLYEDKNTLHSTTIFPALYLSSSFLRRLAQFQSLEWNSSGTKIVGAIRSCACVWSRYDNYTLPQILLKKIISICLVLKRQSKQINSSEKLLDEIANVLLCVRSDLEKAWLSFSKDMQGVIWSSVHRQIQKYGK